MHSTRPSSAALSLANDLVGTLPCGVDGLFNPWREVCPDDCAENGPSQKLTRLAFHLDCRPKFILCGEAPGYQGCRHSGVAFTSERLLLGGGIPRIPREDHRLTRREIPFSEPSATIVWKALYKLGIAEDVVLWNALQMHPHRAGENGTNRTPKPFEIALGAPALHLLADAFPDAHFVAVGRKSEGLLADLGVKASATVRHPANGGATEFFNGLSHFISSMGGRPC